MTGETIDTRTKRPAGDKAMMLGLLAMALVTLTLLLAGPAHAITFTVDRADDPDLAANPDADDCSSSVADDCSLRGAITRSNAIDITADTITFNIPDNLSVPGAEVKTISPNSQLPAIDDKVTIDGYTQNGAVPNSATTNANNAVLKVELNGTGAGNVPLASGLVVRAPEAAGTVIRGLVINRFSGSGVISEAAFSPGGPGATVILEGNFIGTDPTGTIDRGNGQTGVLIRSSDSRIGGAENAAQNVISGNGGDGVSVTGIGGTGNVVINNHIGTDANAEEDLGNSGNGVRVASPGVVVGGNGANGAGADEGDSKGEGNIISGNEGNGVRIEGSGAEGTRVLGNYVGPNRNGNGVLGNAFEGVLIQDAPRVEVGGTEVGQGNTISDNGRSGVEIKGASSTRNEVEGNRIGTNFNGSSVGNGIDTFGNRFSGVSIDGAPDNVVGGTAAGARNVISGNNVGVTIVGSGSTDNDVLGNFVGIDAAGGSPNAELGNVVGVFIRRDASNNTVGGTQPGAGNVISGNDGDGVEVEGGSTGNEILGNFIGTDATGEAAKGNSNGLIVNGTGNAVGGAQPGARNVISGNREAGVAIGGPEAINNEVAGNFIGTDKDGNEDLGNLGHGVLIEVGPDDNSIGGTLAGAGNVISGNDGNGVFLTGNSLSDEDTGDSTGNKVLNNLIGTDVGGATPLGNDSDGVSIEGAGGGTVRRTEVAGNTISANDSGVRIDGEGASANRVRGNRIGTDRNGAADLGNRFSGVDVFGAPGNLIGGRRAGDGNVISGNNLNGVEILGGDSTANRVEGNLIGTDAGGTAPLGNGFDGVVIDDADNNTVGGQDPGTANTISANGVNGIRMDDIATNNVISGNRIGTRSDGTGDLGNRLHGVRLRGNSAGNSVGGATNAHRNIISGNNGDGVVVSESTATRNSILRNSIFANTGLGIDLVGGTENATGATANDPKDPDAGPNTLQNKPAIRNATTTGSSLTVQGNLNSTPSKTFILQFFSNPSGNEGKRFIGQRSVTTNVDGNVSFTFTLDVSVAAGQTITATATRAGNTSEFSAPRTVAAP